MDLEINGKITNVEVIAVGRAVRELARLRKQYGKARWRRFKGIATFAVCLNNEGYKASLEVGKLYASCPMMRQRDMDIYV